MDSPYSINKLKVPSVSEYNVHEYCLLGGKTGKNITLIGLPSGVSTSSDSSIIFRAIRAMGFAWFRFCLWSPAATQYASPIVSTCSNQTNQMQKYDNETGICAINYLQSSNVAWKHVSTTSIRFAIRQWSIIAPKFANRHCQILTSCCSLQRVRSSQSRTISTIKWVAAALISQKVFWCNSLATNILQMGRQCHHRLSCYRIRTKDSYSKDS